VKLVTLISKCTGNMLLPQVLDYFVFDKDFRYYVRRHKEEEKTPQRAFNLIVTPFRWHVGCFYYAIFIWPCRVGHSSVIMVVVSLVGEQV
jgi:hypothetical protein